MPLPMPWRKPFSHLPPKLNPLSATACLCGTRSRTVQPDLKEAAMKHLEAKNSKQANLAGFIAGMDAVLGRLLNSLKDPDRNGDKSDSIANDTLILFTSDNGGTHLTTYHYGS